MVLSFLLAKLTLNIVLNAKTRFDNERKQNIDLLINVKSMNENYPTIPWFSSTGNDRYDSAYSDYSVSAKPEFRRGFRIKPDTYIPFPFWHKSIIKRNCNKFIVPKFMDKYSHRHGTNSGRLVRRRS